MKTVQALIPFAACIAATVLTCSVSLAQDAQRTCGSVSNLQRRVVEHADLGMGSLRDFVHMTQFIHGLGMETVKESLDTWRASVVCQKEVAAAAAAAATTAQASEAAEPSPQVVAANH